MDALRQQLADAEAIALNNYAAYERERQRANRLAECLRRLCQSWYLTTSNDTATAIVEAEKALEECK